MLWLLAGCGTFIVGAEPHAWGDVVVTEPGDALVIDARTPEDHALGHIPGAINVHWTELTGFDDDKLWDVRPTEELVEIFGARGVSRDTPVVVYGAGPEGYGDDGNVYWALRYLGHEQVQVLSGGWAGWLAADGAVSTDTRDGRPAVDFDPRLNEEVFATTEQVEAWDGALLDVRSEEEWLAGHIPGAVWMDWTVMFDDAGALLPPEAARVPLEAVGITEADEVIVYCGGGIRSGHTFMVLEALGQPGVRNYVGSWERWSGLGNAVAYP